MALSDFCLMHRGAVCKILVARGADEAPGTDSKITHIWPERNNPSLAVCLLSLKSSWAVSSFCGVD